MDKEKILTEETLKKVSGGTNCSSGGYYLTGTCPFCGKKFNLKFPPRYYFASCSCGITIIEDPDDYFSAEASYGEQRTVTDAEKHPF